MVAVGRRRVMWPAGKQRSEVGGRRSEAGDQIIGLATKEHKEHRGGCGSPGDWEVLTAEMKRYEYEIGPTGQVSYAAPSGYHDDCVMALSLGAWGCGRFGVEPGRMLRLGGDRGQRPEVGER